MFFYLFYCFTRKQKMCSMSLCLYRRKKIFYTSSMCKGCLINVIVYSTSIFTQVLFFSVKACRSVEIWINAICYSNNFKSFHPDFNVYKIMFILFIIINFFCRRSALIINHKKVVYVEKLARVVFNLKNCSIKSEEKDLSPKISEKR